MADYSNIRQRILDIINPDVDYTQEDFNKEFGEKPQVPTDYRLKVKFTNKSSNPNPEYATAGASGFDLRANLPQPVDLVAGQRMLIPTGLFFELPDNYELQVRPRSGLALKQGITVLNTPGTVDADYRGEVGVILINLSLVTQTIHHGDRIAQGVVAHVTARNIINLTSVDEIDTNTDRGAGGFGSTGKN